MKPTKRHLFLTGFGAFDKIKTNPSAGVGELVSSHISKEDNLSVNYEELEVSVEGVNKYFCKLEGEIATCIDSDPNSKILLVHIGVHGKEPKGVMRLEVRGYNEIHANITDVRGLTLDHILVDESLPLDSYLVSDLVSSDVRLKEIQSLIKRMNDNIVADEDIEEGRQKPFWEISEDAGRYICNYTLYRALQIQNKYKGQVYSMFIHVADPLKEEEMDMNNLNPSVKKQAFQVQSLISSIFSTMNQSSMS